MNTLILYHNETNEILDVLHDLQKVEVEDNNVYWDDGSMKGIQVGFVVVKGNPNVKIGQNVTPFLNQDIKKTIPTQEKRLNQNVSKLQNMINFLFSELTEDQLNRAISQEIISQDEASQFINNG